MCVTADPVQSHPSGFGHLYPVNPLSPTVFFLIVAKMSLPKPSVPYWSNPPFQFVVIRALWRSELEWQKIKNGGLDQYGTEHFDNFWCH